MRRPTRSSPEERAIRQEILSAWDEALNEHAIRHAAAEVAWRAGELEQRFQTPDERILLRMTNGRIETSSGFNIPISACSRVWNRVLLARNSQTTLTEESEGVGRYTLREVRDNGDITVACMRLRFEEIEDIARRLNFIQP